MLKMLKKTLGLRLELNKDHGTPFGNNTRQVYCSENTLESGVNGRGKEILIRTSHSSSSVAMKGSLYGVLMEISLLSLPLWTLQCKRELKRSLERENWGRAKVEESMEKDRKESFF